MQNDKASMKRIYLDAGSASGAWGVISGDAEIIQAGTTIYSMPVSYKNDEYARWAAEYDIHFIFDDAVPAPDFYAVPRLDVFAVDSHGGFIGAIGACADLQGDAPVAYIDREKNVCQIAANGGEFMQNAPRWRNCLVPCDGMKLYPSKADAEGQLEFLDVSQFAQE